MVCLLLRFKTTLVVVRRNKAQVQTLLASYDSGVRSRRRKIPSFSLYGEDRPLSDIAQPAHIENIPSRSKKYLWHIDTHRHHHLAQCVVVTSGPATVTLEETERVLRGPAAIIVPPGTVHSFRFATDTNGFVLTVDLAQLVADVGGRQMAIVDGMFAQPRVLDLGRNSALAERIVSLLDCLLREYRRAERLPDSSAAALAGTVLATVAESCTAAQEPAGASGADLTCLRAFRALVESSFSRHWPVARYARKLEQSETTLNRLCLRLTAHTAFQLLQQRLALEAQRRLLFSGATVSGIAGELGFKDLAYFSRFFRRHHGISPNAFRRRNGGGKVPTISTAGHRGVDGGVA